MIAETNTQPDGTRAARLDMAGDLVTVPMRHSLRFFTIPIVLMTAGGATWVRPAAAERASVEGPAPLTTAAKRIRRAPWARRHRASVRVIEGAQRVGPVDPQRDPPLSRAELRALGLRPKGLGLIDLNRWPPEPPTPTRPKPDRLAQALSQACDLSVAPHLVRRYARWITAHGEHFEIDPFLLAAVIAQQSGCRAHRRSSYGLGLAMINPGMYRASMRQDHYRYGAKVDGRWRSQRLETPRFAFTRANLLEAEANIYFAAAFLSMFREQCKHIDRPFHSAPHRHFVSHFVWGDRVVDAGPEDRILITRRRLQEYYRGKPLDPGRGRFANTALNCPIDGAPRKVTGGIGDPRDGGRRRHTGIDLDSTLGEPVRAVAHGRVTLAGIDWGHDNIANLDPKLTAMVPLARMGPRGLLIRIQHADGLVSVYMHLAAYTVRVGQAVNRGDKIGFVGQTGIKHSPPHLHFELWHGERLVDPLGPLSPYLFPPDESLRGRRIMVARRRHRRHRPDESTLPHDRRRNNGHLFRAPSPTPARPDTPATATVR